MNNIVSLSNQDTVGVGEKPIDPIWQCKVCGYAMFSKTDKQPVGVNMAVLGGGNNLGALPISICPECNSISIHSELVDQLRSQLSSKIITV